MVVILCSIVFAVLGYVVGVGRGATLSLKCIAECLRRHENETDGIPNAPFVTQRFKEIVKEDFPEVYEVMEQWI